MPGPTYSVEQLKALQTSPLVKKPDGLPSILQWMDVPSEQTNNLRTANNNNNNANESNNGTARRTRPLRDGEAGPGNEARTDRPLINPMGQFGRRQSMQPGEDTVLGPPKLSFTSASRGTKATGEAKERTGVTSVDGDQLGDRFPRDKTNERWTRDREGDRTRDKAFANGRRGIAREDGEGWTSVKGRKSVGQEDFERFGRNGDRNREKNLEGELESEGPARRGGRDRTEPRWGRRDDAKEETTKPAVQGGWRDRDRERERGGDRGGDRGWDRGGNKAEEDPEWMDTKIEKKEAKPRTQDDFQRWKEQMRAKDTPAELREEHRDEKPTSIAITAGPMLTAPLHTPSTEPTQGILFGNWSRDKGADLASPETVTPKAKPAQKSRFMTMFSKPDEPPVPSQSQTPLPTAPAPMPEPNADREGFQRILQMLGQVNVSGPPAPPPGIPTPTNGSRHSGGISLDFHQHSPVPEPQNNRPPQPRNQEHQNILDSILAQRPSEPESRHPQQARFNSMSPENALHEQFRQPRPDSSRPEDHFPVQQPHSRPNNPQDANLAAILNSRAREESQRDQEVKRRERDFLLTLMQQPSRATPPQLLHQNLPRQTPEPQNMPFFDQMGQRPQGQPKGRGVLPPGFMEDPRMFNENEMMRRDAERREQELRQQLSMQQQQQQEVMRAKNSRMSIGFSGHDDPIMGLQRRTTGGDPRPMTNMGIPSQPMPDMSFMGGRGQPGMPPTPQERPNIAPPPGFGGPMRQPPGLGGPNPPQQMGPGGPGFSAGNTPLGHPPGFPTPGSMRGGMGFPGGPGGNGMPGPPQGLPQGYFPPPGYGAGPPMPGMLRGGEDPRMMFDGQFGGPGPRQQQGRPGPPPPNMY